MKLGMDALSETCSALKVGRCTLCNMWQNSTYSTGSNMQMLLSTDIFENSTIMDEGAVATTCAIKYRDQEEANNHN